MDPGKTSPPTRPPSGLVVWLGRLLFQILSIACICTWVFKYNVGVGFHTFAKTDGSGGWDSTLVFSWHPLLMIIGFVVIMGEALLVFQDWTFLSNRPGRKIAHVLLHTVAIICITLALAAIIVQKDIARPQKEHMKTAHDWIGVIIYSVAVLQFLVGAGSFGIAKRWTGPAKARLLDWHRFFGAAVWAAAWAECLVGLSEMSIEVKSRQPYRRCVAVTALAVLLLGFFVLLSAYGPHRHAAPGYAPQGAAPVGGGKAAAPYGAQHHEGSSIEAKAGAV